VVNNMRTDLKTLLNWYIGKVFDNEREFIRRFGTTERPCKLIGLYLSGGYTRIEMRNDVGEIIDISILTNEFIAWVESIAERGRFDVLP